jgi:hypothetical protein
MLSKFLIPDPPGYFIPIRNPGSQAQKGSRSRILIRHTVIFKGTVIVPRMLFFAAQQRIAITLSPEYYQKMQRSKMRKNQEEHGPEVK